MTPATLLFGQKICRSRNCKPFLCDINANFSSMVPEGTEDPETIPINKPTTALTKCQKVCDSRVRRNRPLEALVLVGIKDWVPCWLVEVGVWGPCWVIGI
jgi:hypothetical protein